MKRLSGSDEDAERETDWLGCNADISKLCKNFLTFHLHK